MKRVTIFAERHDYERGAVLIAHTQAAGYDSGLHVVDTFPIADPLAALFAAARMQSNVLIILVSQPSPQAQWVLLELLTQRRLGQHPHEIVVPFAILLQNMTPLVKMQADPHSFIMVKDIGEAGRLILDRIREDSE